MDINKLIEDILVNLKSISNSLETITSKNGGVVIHDTFADVSTWVNLGTDILTAIIATVLGGLLTIYLFKKQEDLKIKQNYKLKFYDEYEPMYDHIILTFGKFKQRVKFISEMISVKNNIVKSYWEEINSIEDVIDNFNSMPIKNAIKELNELIERMEELKRFMKSKQKISNYDEFKFKKDLNELKTIEQIFNKLDIIKTKCDYLKILDNHMDKKEAQTNVKKYKELSKEITNIYKENKLDNLEKSIQSTHDKISDDFIGKYFK